MKSAPVIVLAEIIDVKKVSSNRTVGKPSGIGGPMTPTIRMALARMSARILVPLRGKEHGTMRFYSWLWNGQKHGGLRLFRPRSGTHHILFLRYEEGYLHTVGDYPNYDLEICNALLPQIIAGLQPGPGTGSDLFERIVTVCLRAELDSIRANGHFFGDRGFEWAGLTSPLYVAAMLDSSCRHYPNPFGRFAACEATAGDFPGRCSAYQFAREADSTGKRAVYISEAINLCKANQEEEISDLRAMKWPLTVFYYNWRETAERRRTAVRLFASAMDPKFRAAACEVAARVPEARDLPECRPPDRPRTR